MSRIEQAGIDASMVADDPDYSIDDESKKTRSLKIFQTERGKHAPQALQYDVSDGISDTESVLDTVPDDISKMEDTWDMGNDDIIEKEDMCDSGSQEVLAKELSEIKKVLT
eukprot:CAMPEP_0172300154 /NCGR_PEP_ID=MMETSP1058-20130122/2306_1 /TAXON_ID=83371 /ORGANISM="Detonula confervacea, Strain CCMP 353" /LENGTH=110 /DNA_ID=CAMNT_0013009847 /DNA_START=1 /DNA_END=329 /DNA_ORIENTATION=+